MPSKTPSGRDSDAWANFERSVADSYKKAGFKKAHRVTRAGNLGESDWDVRVPEIPGIVLDMKYRKRGWPHHTVFKNELHTRYLKGRPERFGVMHTKCGDERGSLVVVELDTWLTVLSKAYLRNKTSEEWSCPRCGDTVVKQPSGMPKLVSYTCSSCGLAFMSEDHNG